MANVDYNTFGKSPDLSEIHLPPLMMIFLRLPLTQSLPMTSDTGLHLDTLEKLTTVEIRDSTLSAAWGHVEAGRHSVAFKKPLILLLFPPIVSALYCFFVQVLMRQCTIVPPAIVSPDHINSTHTPLRMGS